MKTKFEKIRNQISELNEDAILFDGYEDALVGVAQRFGTPVVACYDKKKCINILMRRDRMTYEEAHEWFNYNTIGCWAGENTPIFINNL